MAINASVTNPADVVNLALRRIGYKLRVGNLYDGSQASKVALDLYSQTRDALLRAGDWMFAERNVVPTLLKSAPTGGYIPPIVWSSAYPPLPWNFSYAWPSDCLKVRNLRPQPIFVPIADPQPFLYSVANDNSYTPPQKVILSNLVAPILVYTGQVTDPTTWEPDFADTLADELGKVLAPALVGLNAVGLAAQEAIAEKMIAGAEAG